MKSIPYNREAALAYAEKWALKRNPAYYDFSKIGGDCTNFISQCLYAGCKVTNHAAVMGWYYYDVNHRAPAWTSANTLGRFLLNNTGNGPYATAATRTEVQAGDIVQLLLSTGTAYHSLMILKVDAEEIYVAAHSNDVYMHPLSTYYADGIRFLHIEGARK